MRYAYFSLSRWKRSKNKFISNVLWIPACVLIDHQKHSSLLIQWVVKMSYQMWWPVGTDGKSKSKEHVLLIDKLDWKLVYLCQSILGVFSNKNLTMTYCFCKIMFMYKAQQSKSYNIVNWCLHVSSNSWYFSSAVFGKTQHCVSASLHICKTLKFNGIFFSLLKLKIYFKDKIWKCEEH